jgi:hypothetical protein
LGSEFGDASRQHLAAASARRDSLRLTNTSLVERIKRLALHPSLESARSRRERVKKSLKLFFFAGGPCQVAAARCMEVTAPLIAGAETASRVTQLRKDTAHGRY